MWDKWDPRLAGAYEERFSDDINADNLIAKFKETWKHEYANCDSFVCPEHYDRVSDILSQGYVSHGRTRVPSIAASEPVSKRSKENGDDDKDNDNEVVIFEGEDYADNVGGFQGFIIDDNEEEIVFKCNMCNVELLSPGDLCADCVGSIINDFEIQEQQVQVSFLICLT